MRRIAPVVAIILLAAFGLAACKDGGGHGGPGGAMPPPDVGVVIAQPGSVPLQQDLVGRLAPFRSADVRARVPGILQHRVYEEGSDVFKGQVLFQIDPAQLQAAFAQVQAAQAQAQATYANAHALKLIGSMVTETIAPAAMVIPILLSVVVPS